MAYIISTLSRDTEYAFYTRTNKNMVKVDRKILIKGGAHVADKRTLLVRNGIVTDISDSDLELLKTNLAFKEHLEKGFMQIVEGSKYKAQDKAEEAETKDTSAQLTASDYKKAGKKAPRKAKEN